MQMENIMKSVTVCGECFIWPLFLNTFCIMQHARLLANCANDFVINHSVGWVRSLLLSHWSSWCLRVYLTFIKCCAIDCLAVHKHLQQRKYHGSVYDHYTEAAAQQKVAVLSLTDLSTCSNLQQWIVSNVVTLTLLVLFEIRNCR